MNFLVTLNIMTSISYFRYVFLSIHLKLLGLEFFLSFLPLLKQNLLDRLIRGSSVPKYLSTSYYNLYLIANFICIDKGSYSVILNHIQVFSHHLLFSVPDVIPFIKIGNRPWKHGWFGIYLRYVWIISGLIIVTPIKIALLIHFEKNYVI